MKGLFEGSIQTAIFLEKNHTFNKDPTYGELLKWLWTGETTEDDVNMLNKRIVGKNGLTLSEDSANADMCYAYPFNKKRNSFSAGTFQDLLLSREFPAINSNDLPLEHTIIIEADIQTSSTKGSSGKT